MFVNMIMDTAYLLGTVIRIFLAILKSLMLVTSCVTLLTVSSSQLSTILSQPQIDQMSRPSLRIVVLCMLQSFLITSVRNITG